MSDMDRQLTYAYAMQAALEHPDDVFGTGLTLGEREALVDRIEAALQRSMSGDRITDEGFAFCQALKARYLGPYAYAIHKRGSGAWFDTRASYDWEDWTILIPATANDTESTCERPRATAP